jgi:hypothetical protein
MRKDIHAAGVGPEQYHHIHAGNTAKSLQAAGVVSNFPSKTQQIAGCEKPLELLNASGMRGAVCVTSTSAVQQYLNHAQRTQTNVVSERARFKLPIENLEKHKNPSATESAVNLPSQRRREGLFVQSRCSSTRVMPPKKHRKKNAQLVSNPHRKLKRTQEVAFHREPRELPTASKI